MGFHITPSFEFHISNGLRVSFRVIWLDVPNPDFLALVNGKLSDVIHHLDNVAVVGVHNAVLCRHERCCGSS
jgi:hypothetical protein